MQRRARIGVLAAFPSTHEGSLAYGPHVHGQQAPSHQDPIDRLRIVPNVLLPSRFEKLVELGREPQPADVDLTTQLGGFQAPSPVYVSALGSTHAANGDAGLALAKQAGLLGVPLVLGENISTAHGYRARRMPDRPSFLERAAAYAEALPAGLGGLVIQQSVEDANAELWNHAYSEPQFQPLLESGRLGFELKLGQGAKPGLGGMTIVPQRDAERLERDYAFARQPVGAGLELRMSAPGTFTTEILRQQIRLMRNNFPRARIWVKLPPSADLAEAAETAWAAGAHAVTVDGAEGGTGLAPTAFLEHVGLPLHECLRRLRATKERCLLASGRVHEGARALKLLALGASATGLGRAALIAADEDPVHGFRRFHEALAFELRLLLSSLGAYRTRDLPPEALWDPAGPRL